MPPFIVTEEPFENIPVLSVIESPHELIEVAGEMLSTHMLAIADQLQLISSIPYLDFTLTLSPWRLPPGSTGAPAARSTSSIPKSSGRIISDVACGPMWSMRKTFPLNSSIPPPIKSEGSGLAF